MPGPQPADRAPLDHADPLAVHTLRAGLEAYIRGDYHQASERFLDAQAVMRHRADAVPFISLTNTLQALLDNGSLVSHDATVPAESVRHA